LVVYAETYTWKGIAKSLSKSDSINFFLWEKPSRKHVEVGVGPLAVWWKKNKNLVFEIILSIQMCD